MYTFSKLEWHKTKLTTTYFETYPQKTGDRLFEKGFLYEHLHWRGWAKQIKAHRQADFLYQGRPNGLNGEKRHLTQKTLGDGWASMGMPSSPIIIALSRLMPNINIHESSVEYIVCLCWDFSAIWIITLLLMMIVLFKYFFHILAKVLYCFVKPCS